MAAEASRISGAAYFVSDVFAADARIIRSRHRAVKSTLTMLVIGDGLRRNEAGAIRLGHLPHRNGAVRVA